MKSVRKTSFHKEKHTKIDWLHDIILGGQDGLVNVLGVVLGVSAATSNNEILIAASLAAAFAEAISMGAVAYTSSYAQKDHYEKELEREKYEVETIPEKEKEEIREIYQKKGFSGRLLEEIVEKITSNKDVWLETMMAEELDLEPINTQSILKGSVVVGVAALLFSLVPIVPFIFFHHPAAIWVALILSAVLLFLVGVYEAKTYVGSWFKQGLKMTAIGLGAALVGFLIGKIFQVN